MTALAVVLLAGLLLASCRSQAPTTAPTDTPKQEATSQPTAPSQETPTAEGTAASGETPTAEATAPTDLAAAPVLQSPTQGTSVEGAVTLSWTWTGALQADQYFEVRLATTGQPLASIAWEKQPSHAAGDLAPGSYNWSVAVVREAGTAADGSKKWQAVSQESETWAFDHVLTATATATYSASLRQRPTALRLGGAGGLLGLGLLLGLVAAPSAPGWRARLHSRR